MTLDDALAELYGAPLDEFVATRRRLAKELQAAGRTEEAAELTGRRKPPLPLWIVNQLARERPQDLTELVRAGERLRGAQTSDAAAFHRAQAALTKSLDTLVEGAKTVLRDAGRPASDSTAQHVSTILRAAAGNEAARAQLVRGILADEPEPTGFEAFAGLARAGPAREKRRPAQQPRQERQRSWREELRGELTAAKRAEAEAARAAAAAERELERARRHVASLEERLGKLRR